MDRFDSTNLFSIFKNEEGENLLPFDEMAALLDLGEIDIPTDVPLINTAPTVTTEGPATSVLRDGQVLPSTSGAAESAHTMAAGWASRPSSDGGGETDGSDIDMAQQVPQVYEQRQPPQPSQQPHHFQHLQPYYDERDGEDVEEEPQPTSSTPGTAAFSGGPEGRRRRGSTGSAGGGTGARGAANKATSGVKKRRQRNAEQMESNRVAQQKYRQRKKQEQSVLQQAVDLLTAQVATLKAVEVRAGELEATNISLQETVRQQGASIAVLQQQNASQAAELEAVRGALHSSQSQVAVQGKIILDQQAKLRLQEQVIASLKDRLKERIDEAMQHVVPGTVCEKMVAAVKATLYDAKDVHGLQETLAQLPEHLVNEMCKNIFQVCKEFWPEMRARCSQQVGGSNSCHMTGTA